VASSGSGKQALGGGFGTIANGLALLDQFSDATSACVTDGVDGGINIVCRLKQPAKQ
jgi:hypothetical protein